MKESSLPTAMQALPPTLTVLGTEYNVQYVEKDLSAESTDNLPVGSYNFITGDVRIYIYPERTESWAWKALLQVLIQAIVAKGSIKEILSLPDDRVERAVKTLADGLYDSLIGDRLSLPNTWPHAIPASVGSGRDSTPAKRSTHRFKYA